MLARRYAVESGVVVEAKVVEVQSKQFDVVAWNFEQARLHQIELDGKAEIARVKHEKEERYRFLKKEDKRLVKKHHRLWLNIKNRKTKCVDVAIELDKVREELLTFL